MTHSEALSMVLATVSDDPPARAGAEAHVAQCWRCFEVLATLRALADGVSPDLDAARAAYGCEAVEERLHEVVGLSADEVYDRAPDVARHLGWCTSCRMLVAELTAVEADAEAGAYGDPIATAEPAWAAAGEHAGRRIWRLADAVVLRLADGLLRVVSVPPGVLLQPLDAAAGPVRGLAGEPVTGMGFRAAGPGGRPDLVVTIRPASDRGVSVEAREVSGTGFDAASLRLVRAAGEELIGTMPADRRFTAVFRDVPAGRYVLGVVDRTGELRLPLALIGPA